MDYVWIIYDKDKQGVAWEINNIITLCSSEEKADAVMDSLVTLKRYKHLGAYKAEIDKYEERLKTELRLEKETLEAVISRLEGA